MISLPIHIGVTWTQWVNTLPGVFCGETEPVCISNHSSKQEWHGQYCGYWWPGNSRSQGITSHCIELVPEYSCHSIKRVKLSVFRCLYMYCTWLISEWVWIERKRLIWNKSEIHLHLHASRKTWETYDRDWHVHENQDLMDPKNPFFSPVFMAHESQLIFFSVNGG